jgi:putative peptide zinc metalloprotease protein
MITDGGDAEKKGPTENAESAPEAGSTTGRAAPSAITAAEFTDERILRSRSSAPARGWRRLVFRVTRGWVHLPPSAAERAERELITRIKTPVTGPRRVAVISRKGGVGKTTTTLMLGHTFATYRGDRVAALDGNPDAGSLGYRVRRETTATVTDLLRDAATVDRYADIRAYTSQAPTRLEVIAADDDPRITDAFEEPQYRAVVDVLERHYNLILLDTGTGILGSATRGLIALADQVVLVVPPSLDGARASSATFDWLDEHGGGHLVKGAVTVINACGRSGPVLTERIEEHFRRRCRSVVAIPWDPVLQAGAETMLSELRPATQRAYLELAAAVADGFGPRWWMAPPAAANSHPQS